MRLKQSEDELRQSRTSRSHEDYPRAHGDYPTTLESYREYRRKKDEDRKWRMEHIYKRYLNPTDRSYNQPSVPLPTLQDQPSVKSFRIVNDTSLTIMQIYGSYVGAGEWAELTDTYDPKNIPPGHYATMAARSDKSAPCVYDFKFVFNTEDQFVSQSVNVCDEDELTIYEK